MKTPTGVVIRLRPTEAEERLRLLKVIGRQASICFGGLDVPPEEWRSGVELPRVRRLVMRHLIGAYEVARLTESDIEWVCGWLLEEFLRRTSDELCYVCDASEYGFDYAMKFTDAVQREELDGGLQRVFALRPELKLGYTVSLNRFRVAIVEHERAKSDQHDYRLTVTGQTVLEDLFSLVWVARMFPPGLLGNLNDEPTETIRPRETENNTTSSPRVRVTSPGRGGLRLVRN